MLLQTIAMVLGTEEAPWEAPATSAALLNKLGYFKKPVLALLDRNPAERPTMAEFLQACRRVLSHTTAAEHGNL